MRSRLLTRPQPRLDVARAPAERAGRESHGQVPNDFIHSLWAQVEHARHLWRGEQCFQLAVGRRALLARRSLRTGGEVDHWSTSIPGMNADAGDVTRPGWRL